MSELRETNIKKYGEKDLIYENLIDLSRNQIKKIDSNSLKGLTELEGLWLHDNEIEERGEII